VRAEPAARQEQLRDLEQQVRHRAVRIVALGDLRDGDGEALDLVGDLHGEAVGPLKGEAAAGHALALFALRVRHDAAGAAAGRCAGGPRPLRLCGPGGLRHHAVASPAGPAADPSSAPAPVRVRS
jgi:hypothetical protein